VPTELQRRATPSPVAAAADAVRLTEVGHEYTAAGRAVRALDGLSLRAAPGELVAVVGPSGCGKSTLLELVCGLQPLQRGSLASDPAVLMPQHDLLLPWLGALDNAALALRIAGHGRAAARGVAEGMFAELGLDGFQDAHPHELSGGMRQRVAFARTLLSGKPVLCLDEPFGALDALTRAEMQRWLDAALARERRTVLLVTHDVEEAVLLADRVAVLSPRPGRVLAQHDVELARPRSRTDPELVALRELALRTLGEGTLAS
jgi:ABC-type nitrate/sulfonate/bicarbonate transport system ATPase subunit